MTATYYYALTDAWHGARFVIPKGDADRSPRSCHRWTRVSVKEYRELKREGHIVRTNKGKA